MTNGDSKFLKHIPCEACGSSDANAEYDDGHTYCHKCGRYTMGNIEINRAFDMQDVKGLHSISYANLQSRGNIPEYICRKYGYGYDEDGNHVASYYDRHGNLIAQKIRGPNKKFYTAGDFSKATLFGMQCVQQKGKKVFITEGEIDTLTLAYVLNGWPVCSVPNGAQGAEKAIKDNLEWFDNFDTIVLCLDSDEPGQKATVKVAELFQPGKVEVVTFTPYKDANEMFMHSTKDALVKLVMFGGKLFRPDGIVEANSDRIKDYVVNYIPHADAKYPWPTIDSHMLGMRRGEVVMHTAGTGIGKSTILREVAYDLGVTQKKKVGILALEESIESYSLRLTSIGANKRLYLESLDKDKENRLKLFNDTFGNNTFWLYDHWGSSNPDVLLNKIRYMVKGCGCEWIILDHLSIVLSGMEGENDTKNIDYIMTQLRSLAEEEPKAGFHIISHLSRRKDGSSHEEGSIISLRDLRGSHSIVQLSDVVIGYERNQQAAEDTRNTIKVRELKNRYTGNTGIVCNLYYDSNTGRVLESLESTNASPF